MFYLLSPRKGQIILQDLILDYENSRLLLQKRIHELNQQLRNTSLQTIERELLTARRDMLSKEHTELLLVIADMRRHLTQTSQKGVHS